MRVGYVGRKDGALLAKCDFCQKIDLHIASHTSAGGEWRFLGHAGAGASLPGEGEVADRIKEAAERYQDLAKKFWNTSDLGARRTLYFSELLPLFAEDPQ